MDANSSSNKLEPMLLQSGREGEEEEKLAHLRGSHDFRMTVRMVMISLFCFSAAGMGQTRSKKRIYG